MKKPGNVIDSFDEKKLIQYCDRLIAKDRHLKQVINAYGYPPFWKRAHGFETLIHIILEQQVSLASARAALNKLREKTGRVTPKKILSLTDEELKACYFSRQKALYARHLAQAVIKKQLNFTMLASAHDDIVRAELKKIKGIGDWTADVYLMMVLQRTDCFPLGDIALVTSIKETMGLAKHTEREKLLKIAEGWRPYRTVAAFILWHGYLSRRKKKG